MGLFGGLAKLAGKVLKGGLSVATGGKSDAILKLAKSVVGAGKPKAKPAMTTADAAAILKFEKPPQAKVTTSALPGLAPLRSPAPRRRAAPRRARAPKAPGTRAAPRGGLDLAKIGAMYRAAGKPMPWRDYVKANANVRKG